MKTINLNRNIRILRKRKGVNQDTLAAAMGVSMQAVSKWESGLSSPDIALLPQLAEYFEVDINDLLLRDFSEEELEREVEKTKTGEDLPAEETGAQEAAEQVPEESDFFSGFFGRDGMFGKDGEFARRMKSMKRTTWDNWTSPHVNVHGGSMERKKDELYLVMMRGDEILNQKVVGQDPEVIRIELPTDNQVNLNVWWSAEIYGDVGGNAKAGTSIKCGNVDGDTKAGTSVTCGKVEGGVDSGTSIHCEEVGGDAKAGTSITCGDVDGDVKAGNSVNCKNVHGSVRASGRVTCTGIGGAEK